MKRVIETHASLATPINSCKHGRVALCSSKGSKSFLRRYPSFRPIELLNSHPLHPSLLKNDNGYCLENIWQFSKIYKTVEKVKQKTWSHSSETHVIFNDPHINGPLVPTPEYWQWREKGMKHPEPIHNAIHANSVKKWMGVLWDSFSDNPAENTVGMRSFDFFSARKNVYGRTYAQLVSLEKEFQELLHKVKSGKDIVLLVDPVIEYPSISTDCGEATLSTGFIVTPENIALVMQDATCAFSFGHVLAALLVQDDIGILF